MIAQEIRYALRLLSKSPTFACTAVLTLAFGIGAIAPVSAGRILRSMLFQVDPLDPIIIGLAGTTIFLLALAAAIIPARRAASIEPMQALRTE